MDFKNKIGHVYERGSEFGDRVGPITKYESKFVKSFRYVGNDFRVLMRL